MTKISSDEKKWQAEADAETMARYEEIISNATRRRAAVNAAKMKANDLNKRASAMSKVAGDIKSSRRKRK